MAGLFDPMMELQESLDLPFPRSNQHNDLWNRSRERYLDSLQSIIDKYESKPVGEFMKEVDLNTGEVYENGVVVEGVCLPVFGKTMKQEFQGNATILEVQKMLEEKISDDDDDDKSGLVYLGSEDEVDIEASRDGIISSSEDSDVVSMEFVPSYHEQSDFEINNNIERDTVKEPLISWTPNSIAVDLSSDETSNDDDLLFSKLEKRKSSKAENEKHIRKMFFPGSKPLSSKPSWLTLLDSKLGAVEKSTKKAVPSGKKHVSDWLEDSFSSPSKKRKVAVRFNEDTLSESDAKDHEICSGSLYTDKKIQDKQPKASLSRFDNKIVPKKSVMIGSLLEEKCQDVRKTRSNPPSSIVTQNDSNNSFICESNSFGYVMPRKTTSRSENFTNNRPLFGVPTTNSPHQNFNALVNDSSFIEESKMMRKRRLCLESFDRKDEKSSSTLNNHLCSLYTDENLQDKQLKVRLTRIDDKIVPKKSVMIGPLLEEERQDVRKTRPNPPSLIVTQNGSNNSSSCESNPFGYVRPRKMTNRSDYYCSENFTNNRPLFSDPNTYSPHRNFNALVKNSSFIDESKIMRKGRLCLESFDRKDEKSCSAPNNRLPAAITDWPPSIFNVNDKRFLGLNRNILPSPAIQNRYFSPLSKSFGSFAAESSTMSRPQMLSGRSLGNEVVNRSLRIVPSYSSYENTEITHQGMERISKHAYKMEKYKLFLDSIKKT